MPFPEICISFSNGTDPMWKSGLVDPNNPEAAKLLADLAQWKSQIDGWLRRLFPQLDDADREDCWQRVTIECWNDFERIRQLDSETMLPRLRIVSKHIALNVKRAARRRRKAESTYANAQDSSAGDSSPNEGEESAISVSWDTTMANFPDWLRQRLDQLKPRQLQLVRLRFWCLNTDLEIATTLGISANAVRMQLGRILKKLKPLPKEF